MASSLIKGLGAIKQHQEEQAAKAEAANRPKADWFSSIFPKKFPKGVAEVRFLQELDPDMTNYNEERGVGFIAVEHQAPGPDGYRRRALCTMDSEGSCYACERHSQNYKEGWRQRQNLYINVLVTHDGETKPYVLSRNANSSFVQALIQEAIDEGSITDAMYRVSKTGEGTTTQWLLKRLSSADLLDDTDVTVHDLDEAAIRTVPYEKQADYYGAVYNEGQSNDSGPSESKTSAVDEEW